MKVRTAIAECLAMTGVETVFGVLGGGNMYIIHDLVNNHAVRYVSAVREDGAVLMADAYARTSGQFAIASVSYGPGMTNAVTALGECARARTPMLVLTGHPPAAGLPKVWEGIQTVDHQDLVRPTGAGYVRIRSVQSAVDDVASAIRAAVLQRRPIVLGVPTDFQEQEGTFTFPTTVLPVLQALRPDPQELEIAVGVIASSMRPIVLAGHGAVVSDARKDLIELARKLNAPLATTLLAKGLFEGEPNNIGVFGGLSSEVAGRAIERADCIVAIGASLNPLTTFEGALLGGKRIVHCDSDVLNIGHYQRVDAGVVGDAAMVTRAINDMLDQLDLEGKSMAMQELEVALENYSRASEVNDHSTDQTVDVRTAMIRLDTMLPPHRTVVTDSGRFSFSPLRYLGVRDPRALVVPRFGAVGMGLGSAIGAAFARPDQPTVLVVGDGGLMMSLTEFNTAVQNQLDLIVVVLNDGAYGREILRFQWAGMDTSLAHLKWPELAGLADAFGGRGLTVRNLADLDHASEAISSRDRPLLIDIKVDPMAPTGYEV